MLDHSVLTFEESCDCFLFLNQVFYFRIYILLYPPRCWLVLWAMAPFLRISFNSFELGPMENQGEQLQPFCAIKMKEALTTGTVMTGQDISDITFLDRNALLTWKAEIRSVSYRAVLFWSCRVLKQELYFGNKSSSMSVLVFLKQSLGLKVLLTPNQSTRHRVRFSSLLLTSCFCTERNVSIRIVCSILLGVWWWSNAPAFANHCIYKNRC